MELAEGIRKIGFRRWYDRQLIESHLFLVSGLLSLFMVVACVEEFSLRTPAWETFVRLVATVAGSALCLWAWRRYLAMLGFAEYAAEHSVCGKCAVYRGIEVTGPARSEPESAEGEETAAPVGVRCRKCGHEWSIEQQ